MSKDKLDGIDWVNILFLSQEPLQNPQKGVIYCQQLNSPKRRTYPERWRDRPDDTLATTRRKLERCQFRQSCNLEDERRVCIFYVPLSLQGDIFLKRLEVSFYEHDFYEVTKVFVYIRVCH
jgi:hypothetical protein